MATIRQLKSGKYQATIRLQGFDKSKSFSTKKKAQSWAKDYEKQIKQAGSLSDAAIINLSNDELAGYKNIFATLNIDVFAIKNTHNLEHIKTLSEEAALALSVKEIDELGGPELFEHANVDIRYKTFNDAADEYLDEWCKEHKDEKNQRLRINYWRDIFGNQKLTEITTRSIRKVINEMLVTGSRPATVLRKKAVLSSLFKYCQGEVYIDSNPAAIIVITNDVKTRGRVLTASERANLLTACKQSSWNKLYLLVLMAMSTGGRKSELLKLSWSDIDLKKRTAFLFDTKNGSNRILSLSDTVTNELKQFQEIGNGLIFPSTINPSKPLEIRKCWDKAVNLAGLNDDPDKERFVFHLLRHGFCSALSDAQVELSEIAEMAGHKSTQTTMRYIHQSNERKQSITDNLANAMGL